MYHIVTEMMRSYAVHGWMDNW